MREGTRLGWGALITAALLLTACDKSGIYGLGREKDVVVPCLQSSTWIRSVDDGTEGLVVGAAELESLDALLAEGPVCFHTFHVAHDSTTRLYSGSLEARGGGEIVALVGYEYGFDYEPHRSLLTRKGTFREDHDEPLVTPVDLTPEGETVVFTQAGATSRLTRLGSVLARLDPEEDDPDAPGGARDVYRLFNLSLFTSQVRVPSFGSAGMTTYSSNPTSFHALIAGGFTVDLGPFLSPTAYFDYEDYQDLGGIVVGGLQVTRVDTRGNGPMEGVLDVAFFVDPDDAAPHLEATVDYSPLVVRDGVAADGHYLVSYAGRDFELEYTIATDEDLRGILPTGEGLP